MIGAQAAGIRRGVPLRSGERLLWEGKPDAGGIWIVPAVVALAVLVPLVIVFGVLSAAMPQLPSALPITFFIALPVAFSLVIIVPLFAVFWRQLAGTRYVLTDRRAILSAPRRQAEVDLSKLAYVEIQHGIFGRSTIYFGSGPLYGGRYAYGGAPAFRSIADGDRVYTLITDARARLGS